MKLRLRSFETKETLKLEIPNPCTLHHLIQLLSQKLPSSSSRSSAIYFSLNQKDNLTISSPEDSIQSTGITSGDLIYFTTNPNGFSTFPLVSPPPPPPPKSEQSQHSQTPNPNSSLELPPCFIQLPSELKLKILDSVSGVDVANMSCVCSELQYLASIDDLWKQKYVDEFGDCNGFGSFKERFAKAWESQKRRKRVSGSRLSYGRFGPIFVPSMHTFVNHNRLMFSKLSGK
ncbi:hypothetical protein Lser_V15G24474 [Lactuca serriola]